MAKARAILKRRKAVRNIRKITKTMQMIATAKFQKSLKRAVGTKPYTLKVRELVKELAASVGDVDHPLLRRPGAKDATKRVALLVLTSNRGLAGGYNGNVIRMANNFVKQQEAQGITTELYVAGKKGVTFFNFQKRPITKRVEAKDTPRFADVEELTDQLMNEFTSGKIDAVYVAYMNFISTGVQRAEVTALLPLAGVESSKEAAANKPQAQTTYDFIPDPKSLLDEILPLTVKAGLFQTFLDATTSEHVARMVAMKSATDNAEKISKALAMEYNRARQTQITTELMEIMGGVEAMAD
jgi:F-type H+-transporting ATPase subunit gamma